MIVNMDLGHTRKILEVADQEGCYLEEKAYILATAAWETNHTMQPVEEAYFLGEPKASAYRRKLWYYPWHGRGFVQLTHEKNYIRMGKRLGLDLTTDPTKVMDPDISAKILVIGSREGLFTGKRLSNYLRPGAPDYVNARRVINGLDCAKEIAALAKDYEFALSPAPSYPNVRLGSVGSIVTRLQELLRKLGYAITVDGRFGPHTDAILKVAQAKGGLKADGIAGPKTWAMLLKLNDEE